MKTVLTKSGKELSPIGIGTYGIGGRGHRDVKLKDKKDESIYVPAIITQLQTGYNFSEISLGYGHGKSAEYFARARRESGIERDELFLTNSIYPRDILDLKVLKEDVEKMYEIFETDYFDSTLVTQSLIVKFGYEQVIKMLWDLLKKNRTRYVTLSNSNKKLIKQFHDEFKGSFFAHETHISYEIRLCQDEGIFDLSNKLGLQTIIWRPLRQGLTAQHNWELLLKLSEKYGKTQNQIVLNWMMSLGFKPEVFSTSITHIKENWEAMQFELTKDDYDAITRHRIPNYSPPKINWDNMGNGDSIVLPVMNFEEDYKKPTQNQ